MSQTEGAVDLTVERNRLGEITSINAFHAGDTEYDRRTSELEQSSWKFTDVYTEQEIEFVETAY